MRLAALTLLGLVSLAAPAAALVATPSSHPNLPGASFICADNVTYLAQVTLTAGGTSVTTTYAYDEVGNKVNQTDAKGKTTRWVYDDANRVTRRILPGGEAESFEYDALGNHRTGTAPAVFMFSHFDPSAKLRANGLKIK